VTKPISQTDIESFPLNVSLQNSHGFHAGPQPSISPLKLSLSQLTTKRWSLSEELLQFKSAGYDSIGLWRPKVAEVGLSRAAEMIQKSKLAVSSLSFAGGFTGSCGYSYLDAIADGCEAVDQAQVLGARNLVVVSGSQNGHTARHANRMVIDGVRTLADLAAAARIKLALLPMHRHFGKRWTFLNTLDQVLGMLDQISHPGVGLAFDTYHLWQESGLIGRIPEIASRTNVVQLSDSDRTPDSNHDRLMPGDGLIPLPAIVQSFQLAGFTGYFDIQVWSKQMWGTNYTHQIEQCHAVVKSMSINNLIHS